MNCSKANAARVNFGRTRRSREVGIRERLRKMLRRSPDPEEIQFEIVQDKGYGGRLKRKQLQDSIMHDEDQASRVSFEVARVTECIGSEYADDTENAPNIHKKIGSCVQLHARTGVMHKLPQ